MFKILLIYFLKIRQTFKNKSNSKISLYKLKCLNERAV